MTHLVYPGARHSRFEHCVGACDVGGRLAEGVNTAAKELVVNVPRVRAAALCHDLGHGPFSHVGEFVFEQLARRQHIHEQISAAIVRHHNPIQQALGDDSDWVASLLEGSGHGAARSVERDIVAGPADVDKLDYLLRDSHFCGVSYGRFDLDKVVESARHASDITGSLLAFHRDGIYAVEELLLARHHMHRQVYGHKTRVATDRMLVRAMLLGVEEGLLPSDIFYPPKDIDADFVEEYLRWDDNAVVSALLKPAGKHRSSQVMGALVERRLMRRCTTLTYEEIKAAASRLAGEVLMPRELRGDLIAAAEEKVAAAAGVDPLWVALHWEDLQNPLGVLSHESDDKRVYLVDDQGTLEPLEDASEIFGQPGAAGLRRITVYVRSEGGLAPEREQWVKQAALQAVVEMAQEATERGSR